MTHLFNYTSVHCVSVETLGSGLAPQIQALWDVGKARLVVPTAEHSPPALQHPWGKYSLVLKREDFIICIFPIHFPHLRKCILFFGS